MLGTREFFVFMIVPAAMKAEQVELCGQREIGLPFLGASNDFHRFVYLRHSDSPGKWRHEQRSIVQQSNANSGTILQSCRHRHGCRQPQTKRIPPFADFGHVLPQFMNDSQ